MSTRSVIGIWIDKPAGKIMGRYHHNDGYPEGVGKAIWDFLKDDYDDNLDGLMEYILGAKQGWSQLAGADIRLPRMWSDNYENWRIKIPLHQHQRLMDAVKKVQSGEWELEPLPNYYTADGKLKSITVQTWGGQEVGSHEVTYLPGQSEFMPLVLIANSAPRAYAERREEGHMNPADFKEDEEQAYHNISECDDDYAYMVDLKARTMDIYCWSEKHCQISFDEPEPHWDNLTWGPQTVETGRCFDWAAAQAERIAAEALQKQVDAGNAN